MKIAEFVDEGLGHSSYLVDLGEGTALVVDPPRFPDAHRRTAAARGLRIVWTADTHSHADYISGSPELAARGARFLAPRAGRFEPPHVPVDPDTDLVLTKRLALHAIATPGHTPEHLSYLLVEDDAPVALFSGGSLMVGTVGRTDLLGRDQAEPLARGLYRALRDEIAPLPDELAVYPTHGAGSFCSAPGTSDRTTTIGRERATNPFFSIDDEDTFVRQLLESFGTFPTYFARLPEINRQGPHLYGDLPDLAQLRAPQVRELLEHDAVLVDARPIAEYARGHVPGSVSIELRPVFASWLGWLIDPETPLVFVLDPGQDRSALVQACLDVGYEHLEGELDGGIDSWRAAGEPLTTTALLDPGAPLDGTLVDVRQRSEYAIAHVPEAINIELGALSTVELPDGPLNVMCGHGERAMTAASVLERRGHDRVTVLRGGPADRAAATGRSLIEG